MSNDFYNHGSFPTTGSAATSASMRAELDLIAAGFDKLPTLTGNADEIVVVNSSGTALSSIATLPATSGGTGFTSYAVGDLLFASTTTALSKLADVATGNALISGGVGVAPTYGKIGLTTHVTGTLPVANGGTGITSFGTGVATALGINVGSAGAFVVNGGALGTPSSGTLTNATGLPVSTGISGFGTGVATALAVNVGTAGAFVVNGGALGTPSSGTLTNATGLPVGTGISGFGTGVATALAVNVGSAGAFVVNGGALGTPSSGTVTNLTGTASININGTVGATTPTTGAFTTVTASGNSSFTSTGALLISKGTTGQQPGSPATGMIRYNTSTNQFEGYSGSSPAWKSIGGSTLSNDTSTATNLFPVFAGATTGTAESLFTSNAKLLYKPSTGELSISVPRADNGIFVNKATVSTSYTIAAGDNGMSAGTITLADGITVTIADGSFWTVV
jgi:hypothetical protein